LNRRIGQPDDREAGQPGITFRAAGLISRREENRRTVIGSSLFIFWLAYGAALQALGVLVIAVRVYRTGRQFDAQPMRAIRLWSWLQARPGVVRRWLIAQWRALRHTPTVKQLTSTAAATSGASGRLTMTYSGDTPITAELRRRLEDVELGLGELRGAHAAQERQLDDARRAHGELVDGVRTLATSGLLVQAWSVVLVIVGLAIATSSPWLAEVGWRGLPVALAPLVAFLVS
jgi:hypothetical protein